MTVSAQRLLQVGEVAELLGCSTRTVRRRIAAGELRAFRDGGLVRVSQDSLAVFVRSRIAAPASPLPSRAASRRQSAGSRLWD